MTEIILKKERINKFLINLFVVAGLSEEYAQIISANLIFSSLRGVDSHGIRLVPHYLEALKIGRINIKPKFKFKKKSQTSYVLDADHGHGIVASSIAMKKAIVIAKKYGTCIVFVKNSTHFAAAGNYSLMAADNNMIGISMTNTDSLMVPFGGKKPFLGTNPIAFAAPSFDKINFCLDMATTISSWNNILVHRMLNKPLLPGLAVNDKGEATINPNLAAGLLPIGGYKGYGLSLMVEILCSVVTGMPSGPNINKMYPLNKNKRELGHFFLVIDITKIIPTNVFKKRIDVIFNNLRKQSPNKEVKKVLVAGDKEILTYKKRVKDGIPIAGYLVKELNNHAEKHNIKLL